MFWILGDEVIFGDNVGNIAQNPNQKNHQCPSQIHPWPSTPTH